MSIFKETPDGPVSCARVSFVTTLVIFLAMWITAFITGMEFPEQSIGLLTVVFGPTAAWAASGKFANNKK